LLEGDSTTGDFGEDLLSGGGPHERFRVVVVDPQVVLDIGDELVDTVEHATADGLVGQVMAESGSGSMRFDEFGE